MPSAPSGEEGQVPRARDPSPSAGVIDLQLEAWSEEVEERHQLGRKGHNCLAPTDCHGVLSFLCVGRLETSSVIDTEG